MITMEAKVNAILQFLATDDSSEKLELRKVIKDMIAETDAETYTGTSAKINNLMRRLGIPDHIGGYRYLCTAIDLYMQSPSKYKYVRSELYPAIAEIYGQTWKNVERAIRYAIEYCFEMRCSEVAWDLFKDTVAMDKTKPTAGNFIARCARYITYGE